MWFPEAVWNALNEEQREELHEYVTQEIEGAEEEGWDRGFSAGLEEDCEECAGRDQAEREVALRTSVAAVWDELAAKRYTRGDNQGADRAWFTSDLLHHLAREA